MLKFNEGLPSWINTTSAKKSNLKAFQNWKHDVFRTQLRLRILLWTFQHCRFWRWHAKAKEQKFHLSSSVQQEGHQKTFRIFPSSPRKKRVLPVFSVPHKIKVLHKNVQLRATFGCNNFFEDFFVVDVVSSLEPRRGTGPTTAASFSKGPPMMTNVSRLTLSLSAEEEEGACRLIV